MSESAEPESLLFRQQAIDAQRPQLLGRIILTPRISSLWLSVTIAALALALVLFLIFGGYTRRVTVMGQLMPAGGVVRVQTQQLGVVLEKRVRDGERVQKGQVLYVLSSDRQGENALDLQDAIAQQVGARKASLVGEIERSKQMAASELQSLERRVSALRSEVQAVSSQITQQKSLLALAEDTRRRYQGLAEQDYIAKEEFLLKEADAAEQRLRLSGMQRDALALRRELEQTEQEREASALRYDNMLAQLEREISSTDEQLTEVELRRRVIISAPEDGVATLVVAELGQTVEPGLSLLTIVPDSEELQARLYAPSSSIGFVQPGDQVLLRYQSFPYQKFGQQEGRVLTISSSAASVAELAAMGGNLAGEDGQASADPMFAIQVQLQSKTILANGQQRPLQAGMQLEADIMQEYRKLYEWMLEPLFSFTQRLKN